MVRPKNLRKEDLHENWTILDRGDHFPVVWRMLSHSISIARKRFKTNIIWKTEMSDRVLMFSNLSLFHNPFSNSFAVPIY